MKGNTVKKIVSVLLPLLAALPAHADDNGYFASQRLENLTASRAEKNSEVLYKRGRLANGQVATINTNLKKGQQYGIYTNCNEAGSCINLNTALIANAQVLEAGNMAESTPVFHFTPEKSGQFSIRVVMTNCESNTCGYAVQIIRELPESVDGE